MKRDCGRPIGGRGGGVCQKWTNADKGGGEGVKNGTFVRTSFMDGPLYEDILYILF